MVPNILPSSTDHHISYHITLCVAAFFLYPLCTLCVYICYTYVYNICCCCYCSACCILFWFFFIFRVVVFQYVPSSSKQHNIQQRPCVFVYRCGEERREFVFVSAPMLCFLWMCILFMKRKEKAHMHTRKRDTHITNTYSRSQEPRYRFDFYSSVWLKPETFAFFLSFFSRVYFCRR